MNVAKPRSVTVLEFYFSESVLELFFCGRKFIFFINIFGQNAQTALNRILIRTIQNCIELYRSYIYTSSDSIIIIRITFKTVIKNRSRQISPAVIVSRRIALMIWVLYLVATCLIKPKSTGFVPLNQILQQQNL